MKAPLVAGLAALALFLLAAPASAAVAPYEFEPELSLTGDCSETKLDPIPDPSCPYLPPPDGPAGKFDEPRSIAIDAYGNEYVASYAANPTTGKSAGRIDVFDDAGHFITGLAAPFGPASVAVDSKGNLYVSFNQEEHGENSIARYTPTVYEPAAGNIEYGNPRVVINKDPGRGGGGLAVDLSTDRLFAAHGYYLREYGSAAEENKPLDKIERAEVYSANWVAVDAERRRLYASTCVEFSIADCGVLIFDADAPHALLGEVDGSGTPAGEFRSQKGWLSIAVNEDNGHFFVDDLEQSDNVYEFDEDLQYVSTLSFPTGFEGGQALQIALANSRLDPVARNHGYLFVPTLTKDRALAFEPPAEVAPEVSGLAVAGVGESEAELRATVDPMGGDAHYSIEYVSEAQFELDGFASASLAGEGTIAAAETARAVGAIATGLSPGTSYRFRVLAKNAAGEDEGEAAFATYSDAPATDACPNAALRSGASATLPDCRAYELVTPPDTNGRPTKGGVYSGDLFPTVFSSPSGNIVSFLIEGGALPGTDGTGTFSGDPYRASRGPSGWTSALVGPSGAETTTPTPGSTSPDQGHSFWMARVEGPAVVNDGESFYVRYPDGHSELIGRGSLGTDPWARGKLITENGTHIVFTTGGVGAVVPQQLEPNAPPTGTRVVYDRTADELTHVVSLLPGDVTPAAGEHADYVGASADGEGIAFEIGGTLYLRKENVQTFEIGENVEFAGVSEGGERLFYVEGGDLFAFETATEERIAFTETGDAIPVNVAPQGARAYFVSPTAIAESGQNPNGVAAQAGEQNLYLSQEGQVSFVATVTERDVEGELNSQNVWVDGLGLWTVALEKGHRSIDPSRLTPDGSVLLFQSRASLDGQRTGGDPQIYRYDGAAGRLHCLSCIPTQVPEGGGASIQSYAPGPRTPPPFSAYGFVPGLRADGRRAFFQSTEALVSHDTDQVQDVYEWEEAGVGSCTRPGGCVYLISSGASERDNYLFGHSASGDDVFFTTGDVLTVFDGGDTPSIYDARVGGGFAAPSSPSCSGEACRPPLTSPPALTPPAKPAAGAEDNVRRRPCPKGKRQVKRKGKVRCVKKRRAAKHRRAGSRRGGSR